MEELLKLHALENVWSSPTQDYQYMFKPQRLGSSSGNIYTVTVHRTSYTLPNSENVYFFVEGGSRKFSYKTNITAKPFGVWDLGPLPPWLVNLPERKEVWYPISELMNQRNLDVWLYKKSGIRIPSCLGYIQRIRDNSFLLAVELSNNYTWDLNDPEQDLNIRFYSNAFFESERFLQGGYDSSLGLDYLGGYYPGDLNQTMIANWLSTRIGIQQAGSSTEDSKGRVLVFINGVLTDPVNSVNSVPVNSYVELLFDRAIYRMKKISISELPGFVSDLDSKTKRAIVPWFKNREENIEFLDDVEFFIGRGNKAVYYHRNVSDAVRQLTNETYSLVEQYIESYITDNPWLHPSDPTFPLEVPHVYVYQRHSGWKRNLIWESHYIKEMVKLGKEDFIETLTGAQSNIPEWRAENLEAGENNVFQASREPADFTWETVFDAYGYNAVTSQITPVNNKAINQGDMGGMLFHETPVGFKDLSLLVFDRKGLFLGCRSGMGGSTLAFPADQNKPDTYFQHSKVITGKLTNNALASSFYGNNIVSNGIPINQQGFACYVCTLVGGVPNEEWRRVLEDENLWEISLDGLSIIWNTVNLTNANAYPAVRFNNHVIYNPSIVFQQVDDGVVQFSINNTVNKDGSAVNIVEHIPYGNLLVFLEDKLLIENIDYFVEWPRVVVTKAYSDKRVSLIMFGICNNDLESSTTREYGWSYRGVLSVDGRWHLRDDRNTIVSYGGAVIDPDLIKHYESYSHVTGFNSPSIHQTTVPYTVTDIVPYSVIDVVQAIEPLYTGYSTEAEYNISLDKDTRIEDYMTEHMDFVLPELPNVTSTFWKLYSPFISRIIAEMIDGRFDDLGPINEMSTQVMQLHVEPFIDLLDFDPIVRGVNLNNCRVLPHCENNPVPVTLDQYMFIKRLVDVYLQGKINLSTLLLIEE